MSVRAAPTGRISVHVGDIFKNMLRSSSLVEIGQKYRTLCMKTEVCFIVADDIKSPLQRSLRVK